MEEYDLLYYIARVLEKFLRVVIMTLCFWLFGFSYERKELLYMLGLITIYISSNNFSFLLSFIQYSYFFIFYLHIGIRKYEHEKEINENWTHTYCVKSFRHYAVVEQKILVTSFKGKWMKSNLRFSVFKKCNSNLQSKAIFIPLLPQGYKLNFLC